MDLAHQWGSDLQLGPDGDLLLASGTLEGTQRVLRRILTGSGGYIWERGYGGNVPGMIGGLASEQQVEGRIRSQMLREDAVAAQPPPVVTVSPLANGKSVVIQYVDAKTGQPALLTFDTNK